MDDLCFISPELKSTDTYIKIVTGELVSWWGPGISTGNEGVGAQHQQLRGD